jgi:putative nucleotidyltransferase with HDIG domain
MMPYKESNYSYTGVQNLEELGVVPGSVPESRFDAQYIVNIINHANQIIRLEAFDEILSRMMDLMIDVAGGETAVFYLVDWDTDEIISVEVEDHGKEHVVGHRWEKDQGLIGVAVSTSEALIVDQLSEDDRWLYAVIPEYKARFFNGIILPLQMGGSVAGVVQIYNYTIYNLELLQILGDLLMTEVRRFIQLDANQQQIHRLRSLIEIIGNISGTLDREQLLRQVTEQASQLIQAERSSVFLYDSETDEIATHVSYHSPSESEEIPHETDPRQILRKISQQVINISPKSDGQSQIPNTHDQAKFGYMGRSAVTVPLEAGSIALDRDHEEGGHVLGGLMAMNKKGIAFNDEDAQLLEILANQTSTILQVSDLFDDANQLLMDFIKTLAATIDAKDPYTRGHSLHVSNLSVAIGRELGLPESKINDIRIGSLLHDVGKIGISDSIINKPGNLTDDEYQLMKEHPQIGYNIMSQVQMFKPILPAIVEHHERLDGTGYPRKLKGEQISLIGRIVAVADVFDALTTDRPYRKALSLQSALEYMRKHVDTHFDSRCFQGLIKTIYQGVEISQIESKAAHFSEI